MITDPWTDDDPQPGDPDWISPDNFELLTYCIVGLLSYQDEPMDESLILERISIVLQTGTEWSYSEPQNLLRHISDVLRILHNRGKLRGVQIPPTPEEEADLGAPIRYAWEIKNPLDRLALIK